MLLPNMYNTLETYWGYKTFRPQQEAIIQEVLLGNDVLAILPTGGGKSLCYQLPALLLEGLCIVITPLIALMQDQCEQLIKKNIDAVYIHTGMPYTQVRQILQQASAGKFKFLYVSPERLETKLFQEYLPALDISLFAIDEAHCISQWGHDFRPPYLRISNTIMQKPKVPIIALTASATQLVQEEIIDKLQFEHYKLFRQSFERKNLAYHINAPQSKKTALLTLLAKHKACSIVYCATRKETQQITLFLKEHGLHATYYHAGLTTTERQDRLTQWMQDAIPIMVCTNAFGMGIDKPNVRCVIHMYLPDCVENYYQEAGRAGRDGQLADIYLLYNNNDIDVLYKNVLLKYPEYDYIKEVYQQLYDFLGIQSGTGVATSFDFSLREFCEVFKQHPLQILGVLKLLEYEAKISFNENIYLADSCQVLLQKDSLQAFITQHPRYEKLITGLLRIYGGILDITRTINIRHIAKFISLPIDYVENQLSILHTMQCIYYTPARETAQIFLLDNRQPIQQLSFNYKRIEHRKQLAIKRIADVKHYISNEKHCYSVFIGNYFGDVDITACGICDGCNNKRDVKISAMEISTMQHLLRQYAVNNIVTHNMLFPIINKFGENTCWKILYYLQDETLITLDYQNNITLQYT